MANKKISELTIASLPLTGAEVVPIVQDGETRKVAVTNIVKKPFSTIANLKASSDFTTSGSVVDVSGYYAIGDGGGGKFYWDATNTETDNGGTIIQVTGIATGRWIRIIEDKVSVKYFGAKGDNSQDDYKHIQDTIDFCTINKRQVYIPSGIYRTTQTIYAPKYGTSFYSIEIVGEGAGLKGGSAISQINGSEILDAPILNVELARKVSIRNINILGGNEAPSLLSYDDMVYDADWVSSGFRDSRYSPQAGISMDATAGNIPPDGGYPTLTYQGYPTSGSAGLELINVTIQNCVVGLALNTGTASQGDVVLLQNVNIVNNKVSIASGQAQANCITVVGGDFAGARTIFDGLEYGDQQGRSPFWYDCQFGLAFELFSVNGAFAPINYYGGRTESLQRLGFATGNETTHPINFFGTDINLSPLTAKRCPLVIEARFSNINFIGVNFTSGNSSAEQEYLIRGRTTFTNSSIRVKDINKCLIGGNFNNREYVKFKDTKLYSLSSSLITRLGSDFKHNAVNGRYVGSWSCNDLITYGNITYQYLINPSLSLNYYNFGSESSVVYTDTTLSFNSPESSRTQVGDYIQTPFKSVGASTLTYLATGAVVTNITGTTVTCALLYDRSYYNEAITTEFAIMINRWSAIGLTGDLTSGSNQLTNVSSTSVLKNGDWLFADSGLPTDTRVLSGAGTSTITLSKNATATVTGVNLFLDKLVPIATF